MTNRDIGSWKDSKHAAKLIAKLVFVEQTKYFSPKVVEAARKYNEQVLQSEIALQELASALNS